MKSKITTVEDDALHVIAEVIRRTPAKAYVTRRIKTHHHRPSATAPPHPQNITCNSVPKANVSPDRPAAEQETKVDSIDAPIVIQVALGIRIRKSPVSQEQRKIGAINPAVPVQVCGR